MLSAMTETEQSAADVNADSSNTADNPTTQAPPQMRAFVVGYTL